MVACGAYRTKDAGMPKRFGTEKQLFEKLRRRLFPQDPHAKHSECLERGRLDSHLSQSSLTIAFFLTLYSDRERR